MARRFKPKGERLVVTLSDVEAQVDAAQQLTSMSKQQMTQAAKMFDQIDVVAPSVSVLRDNERSSRSKSKREKRLQENFSISLPSPPPKAFGTVPVRYGVSTEPYRPARSSPRRPRRS